MRIIHFKNKAEDYSISIPMQFPILRLFMVKDDILWLNTFNLINKMRNNQLCKQTAIIKILNNKKLVYNQSNAYVIVNYKLKNNNK